MSDTSAPCRSNEVNVCVWLHSGRHCVLCCYLVELLLLLTSSIRPGSDDEDDDGDSDDASEATPPQCSGQSGGRMSSLLGEFPSPTTSRRRLGTLDSTLSSDWTDRRSVHPRGRSSCS